MWPSGDPEGKDHVSATPFCSNGFLHLFLGEQKSETWDCVIKSQYVLKCFKKTTSLCTEWVPRRLFSRNHSCGRCCRGEQDLSVIWFGPSSTSCRKTCCNYMGACNTAIMQCTHVIIACSTACWSSAVEEKGEAAFPSDGCWERRGALTSDVKRLPCAVC